MLRQRVNMSGSGFKRWMDWGARAYRALDQIRERGAVTRYSVATLCVVLAFLLQRSFSPVFHHRVAFTFFVTSALVAAWCGGIGPGIYTLVTGFLVADYFFVEPIGSFGKYGKMEWALLIGNAVPAILGVILFESLHRFRAQLAARTANLEEEMVRRIAAEDELREAQSKLRDYALDLEEAVRERTSELNEAVKFLERFCYTIAHDLRAPTRALTGFVNVLEQELPGELSEDARLAARQIRSSAQRMDKLILDLLDYGYISHVPLRCEKVPLQTAVASALHGLRGDLESSHAIVRTAPLSHDAWADVQLLQRALTAIIANALQFSKPNEPPRIHIWGEGRGGTVRLWIRDEGIGVPQEYREKIFGAFQTLAAPDAEHRGIGLAIVRKCIERMRGRVNVESTPGNGAAFWIELPLHLTNLPAHRRPEELGKNHPRSQSVTQC